MRPKLAEPNQDPARPYFLWWADLSADEFSERIRSDDPQERGYWLGALLREANTRDVWKFVTPDEIRAAWPLVFRHLGRSRDMWTWLLQMPQQAWPPDPKSVSV